MTAAIEMTSLSFAYEEGPELLDLVKLSVTTGTVVSILGPSGCGKTTLLLLVGGLLQPTRGQILVLGEPPVTTRENGGFGIVFQDPALLAWRTAASNVALPFELRGLPVDRDAVQDALRLVGLSKASDLYPDQLSGGMKSRVAIARALVTRPPLLLCDEAFGSLDEVNRLQLNLALAGIQRELETTILFVTHNIQEALFIGDRVLLLDHGEGSASRVRLDIAVEFDKRGLDTLATNEYRCAYKVLLDELTSRGVR